MGERDDLWQQELDAMQAIASKLKTLPQHARIVVIKWAIERFLTDYYLKESKDLR